MVATSDRSRLLPIPAPPLDQDNGPYAGVEVIEVLAERREFDLAAADRLAGLRGLRSNRVRSHYLPFG